MELLMTGLSDAIFEWDGADRMRFATVKKVEFEAGGKFLRLIKEALSWTHNADCIFVFCIGFFFI